MAKRPSLADSLMASLNKGVHVDTAEKISRGFAPIPDEAPSISAPPVVVQKSAGVVKEPSVDPVVIQEVTTKPLDRLGEIPLDGDTVTPSHGNTVKQSDRNTVIPLHGVTVRPSNSQTVIPSNDETVLQPHHHTVSYHETHPKTVSGFIPRDVLNLAYNQASVLEYLIGNQTGITNARTIADQTHISIHSVREAMLRLIAKGFIAKPVTVKNAAFQGFSYVLNKNLCDHFINAGGLGQDNYRDHETVPETVWVSQGQTVRLSDGVTIHSSSESFNRSKPTTTFDPQTVSPSHNDALRPSDPTPYNGSTLIRSNGVTPRPSEGFILVGAVAAYWEEEGLAEGQAQKWCQQFEVEPDQMRQQLDWARYDLEINGRRAEVKKDPVSWFFGHLRTTGGAFPRPVNYKTPADLRAEAMQTQREQDQATQTVLAEAGFKAQFQAFLVDPSTAIYQELLSQVSGFAKEALKEGETKAAEVELRELFKARVENGYRP